jgi:Uma2 family endonuclease
VTKRQLYQRRIPEYWIVDLDARVVERWRHGVSSPDIETSVVEWTPSGASVPLTLDLTSFFRRVWFED